MLDSRHHKCPITTTRRDSIEAYADLLPEPEAPGEHERGRDRSIHRNADRLLFWVSVEIIIAIGKTGCRRVN